MKKNKNASQDGDHSVGVNVNVDVDVTKIVKYSCFCGAVIVFIIFCSKVVREIFAPQE